MTRRRRRAVRAGRERGALRRLRWPPRRGAASRPRRRELPGGEPRAARVPSAIASPWPASPRSSLPRGPSRARDSGERPPIRGPRPNCAMRPRSVTKCGRSHSGRTPRAVKWGRLPISSFRLFAGSFRREPISSPRRPWANRRQEGVIAMCPAGSQSSAARWLVENGPRELELLFRAIVYHPSVPILLTDDDGNSREASVGAGKLLGLPREKIIGRRVDDFAQPGFKPQISQLWRALQEQGEQEGTLGLVGRDGSPRNVEYTVKGNVLPVRHLVVLHDKTPAAQTGSVVHAEPDQIPSWVQDYALFLMDVDGRIVTWYSGAERIYGYDSDEAIGQHVSFLYPSEEVVRVNAFRARI